MDKIEKEFKNYIAENVNIYIYNRLKKETPNLYKNILSFLREEKVNEIDNDLLTLSTKNVKSVSLKIDKQKTFIFGGCFVYRGNNVVLLENADTIGTYFLKDSSIYRQLKNYKIGLKLVLIKHKEGINMVLPYEDNKIGLFEDI